MLKPFEKYQKRRLRTSYLSVIVSITVVLFMLGVLGLLGIKYQQGIDYFKNQITMTIFLKDGLTQNQIREFKKSLIQRKQIQKVIFISKQQAIQSYSKDLGKNFLKTLGTNPLKDAFDIHLKKSFVNNLTIKDIKKSLMNNVFVSEVIYDATLISLLNKNLKKISFWVLGFVVFFGLIAIVLINSAIRISMYSKRFIIKTMQMVGATKNFIKIPFLLKSVQLGFIASVIASILLLTSLYYLNLKIPELAFFSDIKATGLVIFGIFTVGIFISLSSTFFAVQKYLKLKTSQLYY